MLAGYLQQSQRLDTASSQNSRAKSIPSKPAYGTIHAHCKWANHYEASCCSKGRAPTQHNDPLSLASKRATSEVEGTDFDALCTATSLSCSPRENDISLDHHLYHHLSDCWIQQSSHTQPFVTLTGTVHPNDYVVLGFKAVTSTPSCLATMM